MANTPVDGRLTSQNIFTGPFNGTEVMYVVSPGNVAQGKSYQFQVNTLAAFLATSPLRASASVYVAAPAALTPGTVTAEMLGLSAGATIITPNATGQVAISIDGTVLVGSTTNGAIIQARFGTGNGPANAASVTGSVCGAPNSGQVTYLAGLVTAKTPFHVSGILTGLTLGAAIWIDLSVLNTTGAQAVTITNATISAHEF
jgi:hypothetical protein